MVNTTAVVPEEQNFILTSLSPGHGQKRLALTVVLALMVGPVSNSSEACETVCGGAHATAASRASEIDSRPKPKIGEDHCGDNGSIHPAPRSQLEFDKRIPIGIRQE
jgi:hypothetical protein